MGDHAAEGRNNMQNDGGGAKGAPEANAICVRENGPHYVTADIHIADHEPRTRATLCRCGGSKNKPFCDGSHRKVGFTDQ
jgi:CDGSH-type Zn-finger protein